MTVGSVLLLAGSAEVEPSGVVTSFPRVLGSRHSPLRLRSVLVDSSTSSAPVPGPYVQARVDRRRRRQRIGDCGWLRDVPLLGGPPAAAGDLGDPTGLGVVAESEVDPRTAHPSSGHEVGDCGAVGRGSGEDIPERGFRNRQRAGQQDRGRNRPGSEPGSAGRESGITGPSVGVLSGGVSRTCGVGDQVRAGRSRGWRAPVRRPRNLPGASRPRPGASRRRTCPGRGRGRCPAAPAPAGRSVDVHLRPHRAVTHRRPGSLAQWRPADSPRPPGLAGERVGEPVASSGSSAYSSITSTSARIFAASAPEPSPGRPGRPRGRSTSAVRVGQHARPPRQERSRAGLGSRPRGRSSIPPFRSMPHTATSRQADQDGKDYVHHPGLSGADHPADQRVPSQQPQLAPTAIVEDSQLNRDHTPSEWWPVSVGRSGPGDRLAQRIGPRPSGRTARSARCRVRLDADGAGSDAESRLDGRSLRR